MNLLVTGVGGQGVVLASDIIGEVAMAAGYDVKKTDTLGMAQRGGSVISHVRIAPHVWSPLIREGDVDVLVGFEKLEAARWAHFLRPSGIAIINNQALHPLSVSLGTEHYPTDEEIIGILKKRAVKLYFVEGTTSARKLGNPRTLNMFILGCISRFTPFKVDLWRKAIKLHLPRNVRKINLAAFAQGRKEIRSVGIR